MNHHTGNTGFRKNTNANNRINSDKAFRLAGYAKRCVSEWDKMKTALIILIILSLGGGIFAFLQSNGMPTQFYFMLPFIILISLLCAKYLYSNARNKKIEWALFGFLGNINALFVFWIWSYCSGQWKKGQSILGNNSK